MFREQGHHYRPRAYSHSSDHSHSGHGSPSATPAPPLMISRVYLLPISCALESHASAENSEPVGPHVSVPPYQPPYAQQPYAQPPYAPQPTYGPTLTPAAASVPMPGSSPGPTGVPHGVPSPQYPPATGASFEPPVQSRALQPVGRNPRSYGRQPLVSRGMDAPEPKPKRRDWRRHPHFKQSRCTGGRKALCVRFSALAFLIDAERGYR
jgi:hypothetical protein